MFFKGWQSCPKRFYEGMREIPRGSHVSLRKNTVPPNSLSINDIVQYIVVFSLMQDTKFIC